MNEEVSVSAKSYRIDRFFKLIVGILLLSLLIFLYQNYNRCNLPVKYNIGAVDSRFNIAQQDVKTVADGAAKRWNDAAGKNVLVYDPNSSMTINLVYDQRQASLDELKKNINTLETRNSSIMDWSEELNQMIENYESDKNNYESRIKRFNEDVQYWNNHGGAPATIFNQLEAEKEKLKQEYEELETQRKNINEITKLLNERAVDYNSDLGKLKDTLDENKNKIITQGLYYIKEKNIDIFTFGDEKELQLVLMHELGHSMGLGHTEGEASIMNEILGGQEINNPTPTKEDLNYLKTTCRLDNKMINVPFLNMIFDRFKEIIIK